MCAHILWSEPIHSNVAVNGPVTRVHATWQANMQDLNSDYTVKNRFTRATPCKKGQLHDFTRRVDRLKQRLGYREVSTMPYFLNSMTFIICKLWFVTSIDKEHMITCLVDLTVKFGNL
jgi:hypothetical protein